MHTPCHPAFVNEQHPTRVPARSRVRAPSGSSALDFVRERTERACELLAEARADAKRIRDLVAGSKL